MTRSFAKNAAVLAIALLLGGLGVYNIVLKATWTLMDDGVFWKEGPVGVYAARVAQGGPAHQAGLRVGDSRAERQPSQQYAAPNELDHASSRHLHWLMSAETAVYTGVTSRQPASR